MPDDISKASTFFRVYKVTRLPKVNGEYEINLKLDESTPNNFLSPESARKYLKSIGN